jgi:Ca2+-binding RTX toxin-like protein
MANMTLNQKFDYRKVVFMADDDYFSSSSNFSKSTFTWIDGFDKITVTSENNDLVFNDTGIYGTASSITVSSGGSVDFSITGLAYNISNGVVDNGYTIGTKTFYGDLAELANLLSGNDRIKGSDFSDRLAGFNGDDLLNGNNGNDWLEGWAGADTLVGGSGNDTLIGGTGKDTLTGGKGRDYFDFDITTESGVMSSTRDIIKDFNKSQGDKIDLGTIDAKTGSTSNDSFSFVGTAPIDGAGTAKLWFANNVLFGSVDKDADAEFSIQVTLIGISPANAVDYILM